MRFFLNFKANTPPPLAFEKNPLIIRAIKDHDPQKNNQLINLKKLLENPLNLSCTDSQGLTALHWAVSLGKVDVVEVLLSCKNFQVDKTDKNGISAKDLVDYADNEAKDKLKPLFASTKTAVKNITALTKTLTTINNEKAEETKNKKEQGTENSAIKPLPIIAILLHNSQTNNQIGNIQKLLELPENLHCHDQRQWSPLHWAVHEGKLDLVEILLNTPGIVIDSIDLNSNTPLMIAIGTLNFEDPKKLEAPNKIICLLVSRGANIYQQNHSSNSPQQLLTRKIESYETSVPQQSITTPRNLNAIKPNLHTEYDTLIEAINNNDTTKAITILSSKENYRFFSRPFAEGQTPLHLAVTKNMPAVVKKLTELALYYRTPVDATDTKGKTPLSIALQMLSIAQNKQEVSEIILGLISSGANIFHKDSTKSRLFDSIDRESDEGFSFLKAYVEFNKNRIFNKEQTLFHIAVRESAVDIIMLLHKTDRNAEITVEKRDADNKSPKELAEGNFTIIASLSYIPLPVTIEENQDTNPEPETNNNARKEDKLEDLKPEASSNNGFENHTPNSTEKPPSKEEEEESSITSLGTISTTVSSMNQTTSPISEVIPPNPPLDFSFTPPEKSQPPILHQALLDYLSEKNAIHEKAKKEKQDIKTYAEELKIILSRFKTIVLKNVKSINALDHQSCSVLTVSIGSGAPKAIVECLLDHGAKPAKSDLHLLARFPAQLDSRDIAIALLTKSPSLIYQKNSDQETPFHIAAKSENYSLTQVFLGYLDGESPLNSQDNLGRTPIHWAYEKKNFPMLSSFIDKASPVTLEIQDKLGNNILHLAVDFPEILKLVLDKNVSTQFVNQRKQSCFHLVMKSQNSGSAELLMASVDFTSFHLLKQKDGLGNTPLHYACPNIRLSRSILEKFPENKTELIQAENESGLTALHFGAQLNNTDFCLFLMNYIHDLTFYFNPSNKNDTHKTPLDYAIAYKNKILIELFTKSSKIVELVWQQGRTANYFYSTGKMPIFSIRIAIEKFGVNLINQKDDLGTALHYAARFNDEETIAYLLSKNADITILNVDDETALILAIKAKSRPHLLIEVKFTDANEYIKYLNQGDRHGNTALHIAAQLKEYDVCKLLIKSGANFNLENKQQLTVIEILGEDWFKDNNIEIQSSSFQF